MIKNILTTNSLLICLFFTANAQTDTSHYDLGRISVKKDFTQSITIKGSDLERYQFTDLADAINVWLYGTYSNSSSLVYVLDGNIINDVNAYSIYDVEEVTLVQNALAQVSGAGPGQQMVLIKLKTNRPGKQGVEAAGQTSLVTADNRDNTPNVKSENELYNQYYLAGYKNFNNTHLSVSADYQRDVMPELTGSTLSFSDPFHFNRFKFNAYGDTKLWKGSTLSFGVNYVPQANNYTYNINNESAGQSESDYDNSHNLQHLFNSNIRLNSQLLKRLTNTLSVAYNHYNYFESDSSQLDVTSQYSANTSQYEKTRAGIKTSNLLVRDNLVYHQQFGDFDIEPSVNFSFRRYRDSLGISNVFVDEGNYFIENTLSSNLNNYNAWLLSPSLNIAYKDIFNLQGGFVSILNPDKDFDPTYTKHRLFPFLSTSVDVAKLTGSTAFSLHIFGSFARQNQLLNDDYATLAGFEQLSTAVNAGTLTGTTGVTTIIYPANNFNPYQEYNNYQAGAVLGLCKNFALNYNFEYHYYQTIGEIYVPVGANEEAGEAVYLNDKTITNHIGLNYNFNSGAFAWRTGLNATESKLNLTDPDQLGENAYAQYLVGHRWSGGFTNRFSYKTFFAGLDILYQLGERPNDLTDVIAGSIINTIAIHTNSFALQNLYAGTQLKITHVKYAEAFINTRNILQNNSSDITDNRRYVGLGFKVGL